MKTRYIGGNYTEITGGNNKVFANSIATHAERISYNAPQHTYGDPEDAKPFEIPDFYIKVRLKESYNGEFGFDWLDLNPDTGRVEKIQDVPFENVEYFYKEGQNGELGNIVAKSTDESGARTAIEKHYKYNLYSKYVDYPYVLMKPGLEEQEEIILEIQTIPYRGELKEDYLSITGDEFYDFEIVGGTKEGKTAKIKVTGETKLDFKIKCLKEAPENTYDFKHNNTVLPEWIIGGLVMMENKILSLKFRVIALVSNEGSPSTKAKALFTKFKENEITKYLNENSLNQVGYKVEIENQEMFDNLETANLDDYLYAFDKELWKTKGFFTEKYRKTKKRWERVFNADGSPKMKPDGVTYEKELKEYTDPTDVIFYDGKEDSGKKDKEGNTIYNDVSPDYIVIKEYDNKLKTKLKTYLGGLIILAEYESPSPVLAFSRSDPLNHYALFVYSNGVEKSDNYSHEIGHMLGLPHLFYGAKEKESYKTARENILGSEISLKPGIDAIIQKVENDAKNIDLSEIYNIELVTAQRNTVINSLENFNKKYKVLLRREKADKSHVETYYINYSRKDKINKSQTKGQYLDICDSKINRWSNYIEENTKALSKVCNYKGNKFETIEGSMHFIRSDYLILLNETKNYYLEVINQIHSNYVMFKLSATKNIMDYNNHKAFYLHNQIKTMRSDIENYLVISCEFCNSNSDKKSSQKKK
ncbi:hypothetical protein ACFFLS_11325 [Flavobacterium procerum]|uniref:EcxA zinc-binding domain-containing protein n=1 Tax=Flavobacterium procerum TaxID=1455569 RepID=A0ABV6BQA6_9FLAO